MTAEERYSEYFARRIFFDRTGIGIDETRVINGEIITLIPWLLSKRMRLEAQAERVFHAYLREERLRLYSEMERRGAWRELADDAARLYIDQRVASDSEADVRRKIRREMDDNGATLSLTDTLIERASDNIGDLYERWPSLVETYHVLLLESVGQFFRMVYKRFKNEDYVELFKFASKSSPYFPEDDKLLADIVIRAEPRLLDAIANRRNMIKVANLSKQEFADLKKLIRHDLYESVKGGLGARDIARNIVKRFDQVIPDMDKRARAMLWARTEGTIVQNDALMSYGKDAEMDGKVWQTVGDHRVRDGHISNEADGIIPAGDMFADGSFDAGTGSVSPFNCRCISAPALMTSKRVYDKELRTIRNRPGYP